MRRQGAMNKKLNCNIICVLLVVVAEIIFEAHFSRQELRSIIISVLS